MQKRILLVGPRVQGVMTGVSVAFELLITGLEQTSHQVMIVNTQWGGPVRNSGRLSLKRMLVIACCVMQSWWYLPRCHSLYMPISTSKLGFLRDLMIIRVASLLGVRTVVHLHGGGLKPFYDGESRLMQLLIRNTFSRVDCCIVLGELLKEQFAFLADAESKTKVVLNGTPLDEKFLPQLKVKQAPQVDQPWRFLYLSNLMPTKGYLELVQACRVLVERGTENFHFDFCGEFLSAVAENQGGSVDEQKAHFLSALSEPLIADKASYHGTVSGRVKADLFSEAHVLVLPTYYPWEGQPLCINEALAWATPVISTRHRGIPEQVIHGVNGYFVKKQDVDSLVECLSAFVDGETPYRTLSENARQHYESHFTNEQHIASLVPLISGP